MENIIQSGREKSQQQYSDQDLKVFQEKHFEVSTATLWASLTKPGNLINYHSYITANEVVKWDGSSSIDRLIYYSGLVNERRFTNWIDGVGYDLTVVNRSDPKGPELAKVHFRIESAGENKSKLTVEVDFILPEELPRDKRNELIATQLKPMIDKYFISFLNGLKYYLETGKPVTRNQFGGPLEPYSGPIE